jgi:hypothetical protein
MVRTLSLRLRLLFGGAALAAATSCCAQVRDVEMKAAYIYNFAQFTTWPEARARLPFKVCADAGSALWPSLQSYNGKTVGGRPWNTADSAAAPSGQPPCDLMVVARSANVVPAAAGMLVVRDGPGLAPAMITLVDDDEHIRFDIDTREAARNGLRFSSKLLRLARTVL